jgi:hypothetical protein
MSPQPSIAEHPLGWLVPLHARTPVQPKRNLKNKAMKQHQTQPQKKKTNRISSVITVNNNSNKKKNSDNNSRQTTL